jgi:hypothetical protein
MLLVFDVTPEEFSVYNVFVRTSNLLLLFVLLPLLSKERNLTFL